ncbi:unknown [[Mannheimia] succiniciproducens MBEL55E]|uniref:Uncharacterized protein n=1 Tax=Mannheimia succiniciproducens (strain KCTC 0769BP / MBEL55E) TaxID=221988 RepID=Q65RE2_MANSM|nr:unknown [[Mannheimia] succiniciproducens MBEL55E]
MISQLFNANLKFTYKIAQIRKAEKWNKNKTRKKPL